MNQVLFYAKTILSSVIGFYLIGIIQVFMLGLIGATFRIQGIPIETLQAIGPTMTIVIVAPFLEELLKLFLVRMHQKKPNRGYQNLNIGIWVFEGIVYISGLITVLGIIIIPLRLMTLVMHLTTIWVIKKHPNVGGVLLGFMVHGVYNFGTMHLDQFLWTLI